MSAFADFVKKTVGVEEPAPSVGIAIKSLTSNLPVPPYPAINDKKKGKAKVLPEEKVNVVVGREYQFITTGTIAYVRVEKIWQDQNTGDTFVVVSQRMEHGRVTHAIHISEFKQRVIAGGLKMVSI